MSHLPSTYQAYIYKPPAKIYAPMINSHEHHCLHMEIRDYPQSLSLCHPSILFQVTGRYQTGPLRLIILSLAVNYTAPYFSHFMQYLQIFIAPKP